MIKTILEKSLILKKTSLIALSSVIAMLIGVVFNKLLATNYPFEYFGQIGAIKSYASTIMSAILVGLNYSYFFLHKDLVTEGSLENKRFMSKSAIYLLINGLMVCGILLVVQFYIKIFPVLFISFLIAMNVALPKIFAQNDALDNNFKRYPYYSSLQGLLFLISLAVSMLTDVDLFKALIWTNIIYLVGQILYFITALLKENFFQDLASLPVFYQKSFYYSKYFFIQTFILSLIVSFVQVTVQSFDLGFLTEFNAYIQITAYMTLAGSVFGIYLFPLLVKNPVSDEQYSAFYFLFFAVGMLSLGIVFFFDEVVGFLYKRDFLSINIIFWVLLNIKVLEIITAPISIRFQAELRFKAIYTLIFMAYLPLITYCALFYFKLVIFNPLTFVLVYYTAFCVQFLFYVLWNRRSVKGMMLKVGLYISYAVATFYMIN